MDRRVVGLHGISANNNIAIRTTMSRKIGLVVFITNQAADLLLKLQRRFLATTQMQVAGYHAASPNQREEALPTTGSTV